MLRKILLQRDITLISVLIAGLSFITIEQLFLEHSIKISITFLTLIFFAVWLSFSGYIYKLKQNMKSVDINTIFKSSRDGIAILDKETRFLDANPAYLKMVGYSLEELREKSCLGITRPEDKDKAYSAMKTLLSKGFVDLFEKRCIRKSGKSFYVSMSASLFPTGDKAVITVRDMSEKIERDLKYREAQKRSERYLSVIDRFVITARISHSGNFKYVSLAALKFLEVDSLKGQNIDRLGFLPEDFDYLTMLSSLKRGRKWSGEIHLNINGNVKWLFINIVPFDSRWYTITGNDITDKKRIEELSIRDRLTGIYNRGKLDEELNSLCFKVKESENSFGIVLLDIDHFKSINDTHGHLIGDSVLKEFSKILKRFIDSDTVVGRWGGEEFLLLVSNSTFSETIEKAESIRKVVEEFHFSAVGTVTASFGVTIYRSGDSVDTMINRADDALYMAKESGRNRVSAL
jgi:diguanylate cyclase (GGDEF)-like protein/PAS domain S-box-containing protein